MRWRVPADKPVVDAVIAAFGGSVSHSIERLVALRHSEWRQTYHWLDASGMALYFLHQVEALRIEAALPSATLARLRRNLADNRERTTAMLDEFAALNRAFQQAGVEYCNLKGFTLLPESCPDPALRCQLDLDFLVAGRDLKRCRELLATSGYELTAMTNSVWEFKAGASDLPSVENAYKPKAQRSIELHIAPSAAAAGFHFTEGHLNRRIARSWNGATFPALSDGDRFVCQAMHIFRHLCSAHTRVAWLLEYRRHVSMRRFDSSLWEDVRDRSQDTRHAFIAVGLATLLSTRLFGGGSPTELDEWTVDRLPASVRLWANRYGREALLADFPGTKLYLLLRDELSRGDSSWRSEKRNSLLPIHRAPRIIHAGIDDSFSKRIRRIAFQLRFTLFRLRFHVIEGLRYMVESPRWKRRVAALYEYAPALEANSERLNETDKPHVEAN
jgi:hypothetical protein